MITHYFLVVFLFRSISCRTFADSLPVWGSRFGKRESEQRDAERATPLLCQFRIVKIWELVTDSEGVRGPPIYQVSARLVGVLQKQFHLLPAVQSR